MAREAKVLVGIEDSTATVLLDNPGQYNALTKDMCLQLVGAFATLAADPAVRAIVLRGADSSFCSGIAIDQMDRVLFDCDEQGALINHFDLVDRSILACDKTTIAVVEGNCYGGGWQLASACDIQLASDQVRLAITPAKIGLLFPRPGIERLVRTVGEHRAKYLLFSGARLPSDQIGSWNLFTRMVPQAELETQLAQPAGPAARQLALLDRAHQGSHRAGGRWRGKRWLVGLRVGGECAEPGPGRGARGLCGAPRPRLPAGYPFLNCAISSRLRILPDGPSGNWSTIWICRGYL
ncbi:enoyl-CoA hydratase/isomerase family protein [Glutamicibacter halophytocola]|uniref:enoyl-CoA hydratase/isomerase family protein n=1 Tax=Glutamicibacter halophytocola TaxID=1933880 RepID=UPI00321982F5